MFEEEVLELLRGLEVAQEKEIRYKPFMQVVSEPVNVLHCDEVYSKPAFDGLSGIWDYVTARRGSPEAYRKYSCRIGPMAIPNTPIRIFEGEKLVGEVRTDKNGVAIVEFKTSEPSTKKYTVTMLPKPAPITNPLQESIAITVWFVTCKVRNLTDVWWRFVGRGFNESPPKNFWNPAKNPKAGLHTIGLSAPYGTQTFVDIVPVFGDRNVYLEYANSAACNTPDPRPPRDVCLEARKKTWWKFTVEAFNGVSRQTVEGNLNIDRRLKVTFTTDKISGKVFRPTWAET